MIIKKYYKIRIGKQGKILSSRGKGRNFLECLYKEKKQIAQLAICSACRKSSFRQAVRLSRMCLNFVFFRASLYKSTAARKKRKTQMPRNHQVSGHFIKKIKICLQMINKKLFSDITQHNVSLRRGSGALSKVWTVRE